MLCNRGVHCCAWGVMFALHTLRVCVCKVCVPPAHHLTSHGTPGTHSAFVPPAPDISSVTHICEACTLPVEHSQNHVASQQHSQTCQKHDLDGSKALCRALPFHTAQSRSRLRCTKHEPSCIPFHVVTDTFSERKRRKLQGGQIHHQVAELLCAHKWASKVHELEPRMLFLNGPQLLHSVDLD